jgi:hypothetical protein
MLAEASSADLCRKNQTKFKESSVCMDEYACLGLQRQLHQQVTKIKQNSKRVKDAWVSMLAEASSADFNNRSRVGREPTRSFLLQARAAALTEPNRKRHFSGTFF